MTTRRIDVRCPVTGNTEVMEIVFDDRGVWHTFCEHCRICDSCRSCGRNVRDFFAENPDWDGTFFHGELDKL